jgi:hypothetical protein
VRIELGVSDGLVGEVGEVVLDQRADELEVA